MIPVPSGVRVWLATGHTDMRKGINGLALQVQEMLRRDPHNGHLFVFRGRRGDLIKVLWHDGQGMCLFAKRLERGRFIWPSPADGVGGDHAGAARLSAGGDRLAASAAHLATGVRQADSRHCKSVARLRLTRHHLVLRSMADDPPMISAR